MRADRVLTVRDRHDAGPTCSWAIVASSSSGAGPAARADAARASDRSAGVDAVAAEMPMNFRQS
jgi:hypothetical protein